MDELTKYLHKSKLFKKAIKRPIKYKLDVNQSKKSFIIHTDDTPIEVVTYIDGQKETKNIAKRGDIIITGGLGEKYVIQSKKFFQLYNVNEEVATPRPNERMVAKFTKTIAKIIRTNKIIFSASWGEEMILKVGDWIVWEGSNNYYRIEDKAFTTTYKLLS